MSPPPPAFIEHLRAEAYHPRSNKHSNALAESIVHDLRTHCPLIRERFASGQLVYDLNFTLRVRQTDWNVDLVLGPPQLGRERALESIDHARTVPSRVEVAVEIKSVMTEHHKAVKNRKRDFEAHHEHVHGYDDNAIAAGVIVINGSSIFRSPLRAEPTRHNNPDALIEHCVRELRSVSTRSGSQVTGLDAKCALVVEVDNIDPAATRYRAKSPAPAIGDPIHYDAFIQAICETYRLRFRER